MQRLVSYPYLELTLHDGAGRALEARWNGVIAPAALRRATLECVTLARAHGVTGWVADDRRLGPVAPRDLAWIATYVFPLLIKWGVRRFARLEAVDPRSQRGLALAQEMAAHTLPFALRSFTDPHEARAWACGDIL
ncbi:hypothetical protein I2I05_19780 [Hymenobacter sp. BT683]|uniref:STAS/SEC14 domain-containing protein n=2 Tax=Hymenobacter jeongseonensis TaxID=2791027 RepID=A0ABS0IMQ1_9BACT|nr:hypothetical protein [Hymenobacter jeongseonensis]